MFNNAKLKFLELMKNKYIRNAFIFIIIFSIILLIDQVSKHSWFSEHKYYPGPVNWDIKVLGSRSYAHGSTTFLDFIGKGIPRWTSILINLTIAILFFIVVVITKHKGVAIGFSIALGGIMGNTLDTIFHGYVRDVLFIPFWDRGTFNFADVVVVVGAAIGGGRYLLAAIKEAKEE